LPQWRYMFSDYIVFVAESGDHSLTSIDEQYPVFVLSFCVFTKQCYSEVLTPAIRKLKFETLGHDMVVLHEHEIRRRRGAFSAMPQVQREAFMERLSGLIEECDFTLIAVVIDNKHKGRYKDPAHPYHWSLQLGLERLQTFLQLNGVHPEARTHVVFEARGSQEDKELELEFRRVCDRHVRELPFEIVIADKKTNSEGLQLADLTARPVGLSVLRPDQPNRAFDVLKGKFFTGRRGVITGNGLKVFPT